MHANFSKFKQYRKTTEKVTPPTDIDIGSYSTAFCEGRCIKPHQWSQSGHVALHEPC